ncbi:substrate-binding domain-containing protein [Anaerocolumna sp. MB42-C2]|uniref:substrate-binding domain-containing protein n=1 Tax=Anaerocolumna sp. MB42-C2 TaxID=3070997 RepID=UPI0027DEF876|nr:substrate-binding domain-containing protein [Anaerocolumna sp. MB42-C2]WMJ87041.1 substrate-binding domain-containing protein [Anaerocolumna sp. MB42-C2]
MNKKIIIHILVITTAFILFIIWHEVRFNRTVPASTASENYRIYLITMDKSSQYWDILNKGVTDMANLLGITYIWDAPQDRDVNEQISIIKNAVRNGANALMIAASDPVRVSSTIEDAKALGVKIIYVDAPAVEEGVVTLATDNYSAGITAGENMLLELESNGIKSGSIGIIGVTPENSTTVNRESGFRNVIETDGRFKLLNTQYAGGDIFLAQSMAQAFINYNPELVGLFGTNEQTTTGIGYALESGNKEIVGIGFDLTDTIQGFIDKGYFKAVMVQSPYTMGYLGLAETIAALRGYDTGSPFINTGITVRTKYSH